MLLIGAEELRLTVQVAGGFVQALVVIPGRDQLGKSPDVLVACLGEGRLALQDGLRSNDEFVNRELVLVASSDSVRLDLMVQSKSIALDSDSQIKADLIQYFVHVQFKLIPLCPHVEYIMCLFRCSKRWSVASSQKCIQSKCRTSRESPSHGSTQAV